MGQRRLQTEKPQSLRISVEKIRRKKEIKENIFVCVIKIWFLFLFLFILCVCLFGLCGWGYTSSISESTQENKDAWTSQKVLDNFFPGYTFYFLFFKGCCCCCRYDDTFLCCCASRFTNISSAVGLSTTNFPNDFRRFGTWTFRPFSLSPSKKIILTAAHKKQFGCRKESSWTFRFVSFAIVFGTFYLYYDGVKV